MKFYLYLHGQVVGPYAPDGIAEMFGGIHPDTPVCTQLEYDAGRTEWHMASTFPELAGCVKPEIAEPLPRYSSSPLLNEPLNILSTDDDANIRALLWSMLGEAGHNVEFAKDGEEVFRRLAAKRYDLIILDVNMPKMNGYKVSELIHEKLTNPPKVIIFTGRDLEKEKLQFVCSGADAILNKGTGNEKLLETIEGLFRKAPPASPEPSPDPVPEPPPPALCDLVIERTPQSVIAEDESRLPGREPAASPPVSDILPPAPVVPAAAPEPPRPVPAAPAAPVPAHAGARPENDAGVKRELSELRRMIGNMVVEFDRLALRLETLQEKTAKERAAVDAAAAGAMRRRQNFLEVLVLLLLLLSAALAFLS